jgi:hypothetical protein
MLYAMLCTSKQNAPAREVLPRRMGYTYPEGMNVVAEYWLTTPDPNVILIIESDDFGALMANFVYWDDVFDIRIFPAVTAEDGLRLAQQTLAGATVT